MIKIDCDVVRDLLPLYHEGVTSEETNSAVSEHLDSCDECKKEYQKIKHYIKVPSDNNIAPLKKVRKRIIWKQFFAGVLGFVIMLAVFFGSYTFIMEYKFSIDYEDISDKIVIEEKGGYNVKIYMPDRDFYGLNARYEDLRTDEENGIIEQAMYVSLNDTFLTKFFPKKDHEHIIYWPEREHSSVSKLDQNGDLKEYQCVVVKVYYQKMKFNGKEDKFDLKSEPVLIWEKDNKQN